MGDEHRNDYPDEHRIPVPRDDLKFTVEMALKKARRIWPRKHGPGDHDRFRPVADAIVAHLELCGIRCYRQPPAPGHSTPDPWAGSRRDDGENGTGG